MLVKKDCEVNIDMKGITLVLLAILVAAATFCQINLSIGAESPDWESAFKIMTNGAKQMIEGRNFMQQKKDLGSAEKMIKDGHRTMMEAEKNIIRAQNNLMKLGAKTMMEGLQILKTKNDTGEAEKRMTQGQQMILEADKLMADTRPERMMQGSRTMMRGLRMKQERDLNTADRLMTEGQGMMRDAEQEGKDKN
jgi:hypothetical protein